MNRLATLTVRSLSSGLQNGRPSSGTVMSLTARSLSSGCLEGGHSLLVLKKMAEIWLMKSSSDDSDYCQLLRSHNYNPVNVPVLEFDFLNQSVIKDTLHNFDNYLGIIFTSPRAVQAVSEIYGQLPFSVHQEWEKRKIFVVGPASCKLVKNNLKLCGIGADAFNAEQLAKIIAKEVEPFAKPLFFPCGNLKLDALPRALANNDINFQAITCYNTKIHRDLRKSLSSLIHSGNKPAYIVFFSPSCVNYSLPLLKELNVDVSDSKIIAIGPSTNEALVCEKVSVHGICPSPSPEGLMHVLTKI